MHPFKLVFVGSSQAVTVLLFLCLSFGCEIFLCSVSLRKSQCELFPSHRDISSVVIQYTSTILSWSGIKWGCCARIRFLEWKMEWLWICAWYISSWHRQPKINFS